MKLLLSILFAASAQAQIALSGSAALGGSAALTYATPPPITPPDITAPGVSAVASNTASGVTSFDTLITVGGANRALLAFVWWGDELGTDTSAFWLTETAETNDNAMRFVGHTDINGDPLDELFYGMNTYWLTNPPTGTLTVRVTFDGSTPRAGIALYALTNCAFELPRQFVGHTDQGEGDRSDGIASSSTDLVIDALHFEHSDDEDDFAPDASQTMMVAVPQNNRARLRSTTKPGAGSVNMSWTQPIGPPEARGTMHHVVSLKGASQ